MVLLSHNSITLFPGVFNDFAKVFFEAGCVLTKVLIVIPKTTIYSVYLIETIQYIALAAIPCANVCAIKTELNLLRKYFFSTSTVYVTLFYGR